MTSQESYVRCLVGSECALSQDESKGNVPGRSGPGFIHPYRQSYQETRTCSNNIHDVVFRTVASCSIQPTFRGHIAYSLAVTSYLRSVRRLLVRASAVPSSPILVTLMKEALRSSETSALTRATRRNIPEDTILHSHRRENLNSYIALTGWTLAET
jgi:hypothetical protein